MAASPTGRPSRWWTRRAAPSPREAFRGQPSAVFFGFTHCPEVCPTTLFELDGWLKKLGPRARTSRPISSPSIPSATRRKCSTTMYCNVSDRITGITGKPTRVAAMIKAFGIYAKKVPVDGGDYTMDHTASVLLLSRGGQFAGTIAYGENAETALAKLKRLAAEGMTADGGQTRFHVKAPQAPRRETLYCRSRCRSSRTTGCRSPSTRSTRSRDPRGLALRRRRPRRDRATGRQDRGGDRSRSGRRARRRCPISTGWHARWRG